MTTNPKPKPKPTAAEALKAIKFELQGQKFIWHTICRVIAEKTGCEYYHADKIGIEMLSAGHVVAADPIGLTCYSTFKLSDK